MTLINGGSTEGRPYPPGGVTPVDSIYNNTNSLPGPTPGIVAIDH